MGIIIVEDRLGTIRAVNLLLWKVCAENGAPGSSRSTDAKLVSLEKKYTLDKKGEDGYNNNRRALLQGS